MIGILLLVLAAGLIILAIMSQNANSRPRGQRRNRTGGVDKEFVARKWTTIEQMVVARGNLRDAVMEADKLVDYVLKQSGTRGETMGDRLKNSGKRFSNINAIWNAHKLRNTLAHEATFDLVPSQAKEAILAFKKGLHDLGAL